VRDHLAVDEFDHEPLAGIVNSEKMPFGEIVRGQDAPEQRHHWQESLRQFESYPKGIGGID
jgi:hypothetical protein